MKIKQAVNPYLYKLLCHDSQQFVEGEGKYE